MRTMFTVHGEYMQEIKKLTGEYRENVRLVDSILRPQKNFDIIILDDGSYENKVIPIVAHLDLRKVEDKKTVVEEFLGRTEAERIIEKSIKAYKEKFNK